MSQIPSFLGKKQTDETGGSWKLRYPGLAKYLGFLQFVIQLLTGLVGTGIFLWTVNAIRPGSQIAEDEMAVGRHILYGLGGELAVVIAYVGGMANIEIVRVICNIEQETVLGRVELQKITRPQK